MIRFINRYNTQKENNMKKVLLKITTFTMVIVIGILCLTGCGKHTHSGRTHCEGCGVEYLIETQNLLYAHGYYNDNSGYFLYDFDAENTIAHEYLMNNEIFLISHIEQDDGSFLTFTLIIDDDFDEIYFWRYAIRNEYMEGYLIASQFNKDCPLSKTRTNCNLVDFTKSLLQIMAYNLLCYFDNFLSKSEHNISIEQFGFTNFY